LTTRSEPIANSVLLLIQQPCFRRGVQAALRDNPETSTWIVHEAPNPKTACQIVADHHPLAVVVDISGLAISALDLVRFTRCSTPTPPVLTISTFTQRYSVQEAFASGAAGYLLATASLDEIVRAITSVSRGETYLDPALVVPIMGLDGDGETVAEQFPRSPIKLTSREADVLRRFAHGFSAKEIARELRLSQKSVETYKVRGATKLGLESRAQIVRFAQNCGWFAPIH